jgi:amino acid permease
MNMSSQKKLIVLVCCALYLVFPILTFIDQQHILSFVLASMVLPLYFLIHMLLEPKSKNDYTQNLVEIKVEPKQKGEDQINDLEHPLEHGFEMPSI